MNGAQRRGPYARQRRGGAESAEKGDFAAVVEVIAKGPPPEWLVGWLKAFSEKVGSDFKITPDVYRQYKRRMKQVREAVDTLSNLVSSLPEGLLPEVLLEFDEIREPELKDWLDQISRQDKGRRPHVGRELCADVIVWCWEHIRGKVKSRSDTLYLACEEYWRACGGEPSSDIQSWRRMVEHAATRGRSSDFGVFMTHNMLIHTLGEPVRKPPSK
jgi:hypothetical protein